MRRSIHLNRYSRLVAVSFLTLTSTVSLAQIPDNLTAVPTGEASVEFEYYVSNFGRSGEDGVRFIANFFTQEWTAEHLRLVPQTLDWTASIEVLGLRGGRLVSPSLEMAETQVGPDEYEIQYTASFGTNTYSIEIYDGDLLVGRRFGIPSGEPGVSSSNDPICEALGTQNAVDLGVCEWVVAPGFRQNNSGECEFEFTGERRDWFFDGTRVEGDRIVMREELSAPPELAAFRVITIQGSDLRSGVIRNQRIAAE